MRRTRNGPKLEIDDEEDANADKQQGVLRAVLNGSSLSGMVLSPKMSGTASLSLRALHRHSGCWSGDFG